MFEYEINVARNGGHAALIKLGRISYQRACEEAIFYQRSLTPVDPELTFTLYKVPAQSREQIKL